MKNKGFSYKVFFFSTVGIIIIFPYLFLTSCGSSSRMGHWDGTGTCYGTVVEIHFSGGSFDCPRHLSTLVTTSKEEIFVVCGHQDFIQLGDKVWVKKNIPTAKDRHSHYAYIEGYRYAIE